jgi:monoamine oxidase
VNKHILILGAGLSGLTLGYLLKNAGYKITILEARNRLGGRIHTTQPTAGHAHIDLGPAWIWEQNTAISKLLTNLGLSIYEQHMQGNALFEASSNQQPQRFELPKNQETSYRIVNGNNALIHKLAAVVGSENMHLNTVVEKLTASQNCITAVTSDKNVEADLIVSTIPPRLFHKTIATEPELPLEIRTLASKTHTWMAESVKCGLRYKTKFWEKMGLSGNSFSNVGPFTELYDHSTANDEYFALAGFLKPDIAQLEPAIRKRQVLAQLHRLYGAPSQDYLTYEEQVWSQEMFTHIPYEHYIAPHANNGHRDYQKVYLDNRLILSGSETATAFAGYLEGAVRSAQEAFGKIVLLN